VIVSLRSSVSEILTEQTLGRGLRLPFGQYTGIEILDTLEVVAHEKYEELLKRSGAKINQEFIDLRTHIETRRNSLGQEVLVTSEVEVGASVDENEDGDSGVGEVAVTDIESRKTKAEDAASTQLELRPSQSIPPLLLPKVTTRQVKADFSLADITFDAHANPFRSLGERLAVAPDEVLRRTRIGAKIEVGADGLRRTVMTTTTVADKVKSEGTAISLEDGRRAIADRILGASVVPPRRGERAKLQPILDEFFEGLEMKAGDKAAEILSAYLDRAAQRLIELVTDEARKHADKPKIQQTIDPFVFAPVRVGKPETSTDLAGSFKKGVGYGGWAKSLYEQNWFDSAPERDLAVVLDTSEDVAFWVRLLTGDLEIAWENGRYNPDLVAVEQEGTHWLIEVKSDKGVADSEEVKLKRKAAQRWANHVSAAPKMNGVKWRYLLARESDIAAAKGSWSALKGLGIA
jgi:type III restriction enzyme